MPVSRTTSWTDDTEISASAAAARLKAVTVYKEVAGSAGFIQFWNVANPDPGTTAPLFVLPVPAARGMFKFVFPAGYVFGTAITYMPTTTHDGETAMTDAMVVEVFYEPL